jgi:hypothetical protein
MSDSLSDVDETARQLTCFASTLRTALARKGVPLRHIQQRLRDLGYPVSTSTLSMWQTGRRRPERDTSFDVLHALEEILELDVGALAEAVGPSSRVRGADTRQLDEEHGPGVIEVEPELIERSTALGVHLTADGGVAFTVTRTLWQARRHGARHVTVVSSVRSAEPRGPEMRGTMGCDLVDVEFLPLTGSTRATLRLTTPLAQGELALTERVELYAPQVDADRQFTAFVPARQSEVMIYVVFSPLRVPARCRTTVTTSEGARSHLVRLNGTCAAHAAPDFGPGAVQMSWEW